MPWLVIVCVLLDGDDDEAEKSGFAIYGDLIFWKQILRHAQSKKQSVMEKIHDLASLRSWMTENEPIIDKNPAAFCSLELALLDVISQYENQSVEELLGIAINREVFKYTAVLGNSSLSNFQTQLTQYQKLGFNDFKVKLSGKLYDDKTIIQLKG